MIDYMKDRLSEQSTWKGLISLICAIIMVYTPDDIDKIIISLMSMFGITEIFKVEKKSQ